MSTLKKHSLVATVAIMGSRIFGLVREQVFAFFFGASMAQDAFVAAFRIPNLLRDLFAEGALSQSFVTVFSQKLKEGDDKAWRLANTIITFVLITVGIITVAGIVFSPNVIHLVATGFTGDKFNLTVTLNRVLFPFILTASLAALFMAMLNAKDRYFLPQSASTFFNITSVLTGLALAVFLAPDYVHDVLSGSSASELSHHKQITLAITGMAVGSLAGGIVQWLIQYPSLRRLGYRLKPNLDFSDPAFWHVLKLTGPAIIGGAAVQVNVMINTYFASFLSDGSVSYLNYAFRFMQFPLGVFGVALASASAPKLARLLNDGKSEDFRNTLAEAIKFSLFLSIPSTFGLYFLASPIVSLIYEHGHFSPEDTRQTAMALMSYSLGIVSYSLIKIYQPAYLACHDARTPMIVSLVSVGSNFAVNWYLVRVMHFPHWGLALGVSAVASLNFIVLAALFDLKIGRLWNTDILGSLARTFLASFAMTVVILILNRYLNVLHYPSLFIQQITLALVPTFIGGITYFFAALLVRHEEALFFWRAIKRVCCGKSISQNPP